MLENGLSTSYFLKQCAGGGWGGRVDIYLFFVFNFYFGQGGWGGICFCQKTCSSSFCRVCFRHGTIKGSSFPSVCMYVHPSTFATILA